MQSGRKSARFACAEGVRLPEREARTPEGPQGAEQSGTVVNVLGGVGKWEKVDLGWIMADGSGF